MIMLSRAWSDESYVFVPLTKAAMQLRENRVYYIIGGTVTSGVLLVLKTNRALPAMPPWSHMAAALVLPTLAVPAAAYAELKYKERQMTQ